jgi:CBS-domain-containing membrane protein
MIIHALIAVTVAILHVLLAWPNSPLLAMLLAPVTASAVVLFASTVPSVLSLRPSGSANTPEPAPGE